MIYSMRGDAYHAGPVMLSDVYTSAVGSAKDGVAASQRALYDAYNSLNSSKAGLTNSNNGVYSSHQIFANDTKCAIQAVNGTTASRLQVGDDGYVAVYKTTDNGATWDNIKSLTATVPYGHKGSNGNFNNLTDTGIWRVDGGWTNGPAHSAYDQVLVVHGSADTVGQMVFRHDTSEIYFRTGNPLATSSPAWRAWKGIYRLTTLSGFLSGSAVGYRCGDIVVIQYNKDISSIAVDGTLLSGCPAPSMSCYGADIYGNRIQILANGNMILKHKIGATWLTGFICYVST